MHTDHSLVVLLLIEIAKDQGVCDEIFISRIDSLLSKIRELNAFGGLGFLNELNLTSKDLTKYWSKYLEPAVTLDMEWFKRVRAACYHLRVEAEDYAKRMSELTYLFLGEYLTAEEFSAETMKFSYLGLWGLSASLFKVSVNQVFADFFDTDKPEVPNSGSLGHRLFPRRLAVHIAQKLMAPRSRRLLRMKDCEKIYTIFQGLKKGLLPIRPDAIDTSLVKHRLALTKDPSVSQKTFDELGELLEREFPDLPRCVARREGAFRDGSLSVKSTVEKTMNDLGQVGWCRDEFYGEEEVILQPPMYLLGHRRRVGGYGEELVYGPELSDKLMRELLSGEVRRTGWFEPKVRPSVVLEPLKGRIITKPRVGEYAEMNCLQKALWNYLQKFPCFALSGRPVTVEDIWYVSASWEFGKGFVSGDYSGATDNLKGEVSKLILSYSLSQIRDPVLYQRCMESFLHSQILYDKTPVHGKGFPELYRSWSCMDCDDPKQENGQLMGHVLSFPILCIANYLIFKLAFKRLGRESPKVLVNGDDILFCATKEEYQFWWKLVEECGFYPSVGKNLFSPSVAQINSVLFRITHDFLNPDPFSHFIRRIDEVNYVSFGLFLNRGKGKQGSDLKRTGIGAFTDDDESLFGRIPALNAIYDALRCTKMEAKRINQLFRSANWELLQVVRSCTGFDLFRDNSAAMEYVLRGSLSSLESKVGDMAEYSSLMKGLSAQIPLCSVRRLRQAGKWYRACPFGHLVNPVEDDKWINLLSV